MAMERLIRRINSRNLFTGSDLLLKNDQYLSLETHSMMNRSSAEECVLNLNDSLETSYKFIREARVLVLSLGTAWGYEHESLDGVAANCHKIPQKEFKKKLSTIDEITDSLKTISKSLRAINKDIKILYTLSPVRHWKDGVVQNQQSKARLHTAIQEAVDVDAESYYFPSYEILLDELRDYRFYANDMLHPNEVAISYIWNRFSEAYFDESTKQLNTEIDKVQKSLAHRPLAENSIHHKKFLTKLQVKIEEIQQKHPQITFS
tara:strand:- start:782 stop:1567 length:786 start_codon:yes stop_codon:yes gene_type:complete